jgi:hypothetical protein
VYVLLLIANSSLNARYQTVYQTKYYVLLELAKSGFGWARLTIHLAKEAIEANTLCKVSIQLGWLANIDVIQHSSVQIAANDTVRTLLRRLL